MSQQVRFAPSSLDVCYVRNGHVTINRADGSETRVGPGHHCDWLDELRVAMCPPEDGSVLLWVDGVGAPPLPMSPPVPAGNTLTAASGKVAVHRTDPRRVLTSWGETILGATDPVLSADGRFIAYLMPDFHAPGTSTLIVGGDAWRELATVAPLRPRFSNAGNTLVWQDGSAIYGIRDVANPTSPVVRLSREGDACSSPVAIWCPIRGELLVAYVQSVSDTEGDIIVAGWESCLALAPTGYVMARSGGSGFDLDAKELVPDDAKVAYLRPDGTLARATVSLDAPRTALPLPPTPPVVVPPEPLPDIPWTTDPHGVVEDIWPWIRDNATDLSPDGTVARILKSDEVNIEGQTCAEHWDHDADYIGHLEDSSTGHRWWAAEGKRVNAIDWVNLGEPEPWFNLPLERNYWNAGARLWLPRRCVSGYERQYVTDINWTPSGYVQPNIRMRIRVDVGYARINGREAFVRGVYGSSDNGGHSFNEEPNLYGPSGWVSHTPAGS